VIPSGRGAGLLALPPLKLSVAISCQQMPFPETHGSADLAFGMGLSPVWPLWSEIRNGTMIACNRD